MAFERKCLGSNPMADETPVYFNPWDPEFRNNPYSHYGAMLAGPPRIFDWGPFKIALVARYADVISVLRDHEHFSNIGPPPPPEAYQGRLAGSRNLLNTDPPVHSRLRRLVSRDFTPRRMRELEPRIRDIAAGVLDSVERSGEFDAVKDLAGAIPVKVIAEMLGVPDDLDATFKQWSDKLIDAGNNLPGTPTPPDVVQTLDALTDYFSLEIDKRRRAPGPDLVSALVRAHDEGDVLSPADLLNFVSLLLIAGNATTTNLIANGTLALMRNPDQLQLLNNQRELLPDAIEEMLRYDGPVQATARFPKQAVNVGGTEIQAGAIAFIVLGAADRDFVKFYSPNKFDIRRTPNEHVAFGEGIHFCLGANLARLEAAIAFDAMLDRFPRLHLKDPEMTPRYKGSYFLRGIESLPMAIE
jgi:cytochrome P450